MASMGLAADAANKLGGITPVGPIFRAALRISLMANYNPVKGTASAFRAVP